MLEPIAGRTEGVHLLLRPFPGSGPDFGAVWPELWPAICCGLQWDADLAWGCRLLTDIMDAFQSSACGRQRLCSALIWQILNVAMAAPLCHPPPNRLSCRKVKVNGQKSATSGLRSFF